MTRFGGILVVCATALLSMTATVSAQESTSPFEGKKTIGFEPSSGDKLQMARRLIGSQRYQEAADLLETIYQSDPDNDQVQNLLRACYDQSKQYPKAELLARKMLEKQPTNFGLRIYLAETLVRMSRLEEALSEYDRAAATFERSAPIEANSYLRGLVRSLVANDLDSVALTRIDQARMKTGDATLLAAERGGIFEKRQQYRQAVSEYLPPLLRDTTTEARQAERRLVAMLEFEGSAAQVEPMLKDVADSTSSVRIMTLLADHFMKAGRFDEAFSYCLRQDSLEGGSGIPLLMFARSCQDRRAWEQVVRMADIILQRKSGGEFTTDASLQKARALAELGRPEEAAEVYRQLAAGTDNPQVRGDAVYGLGVLASNYLHDYESALTFYDSVVANYPRGQQYIYARKEIPICHLRLGHTEEARTGLSALLKSRLSEEIQEEVVYLTGLAEFFDKKYDTAEAIFRKLIVDYPKGFYVNDALGLVLTISDAKTAGPALDQYSEARYAAFQGNTASARVSLVTLAGDSTSVLADLALYELTRLELAAADSTAAAGFVDRLDREHPESYYRPLGLKMKADMQVQSGRDLKQAMEIYRVLLENYSEYPFAREVREKLRDLDSRVPAS